IPMTLYVWYLFPYNVSMVVLYVLVIAVALIGNILVCAAVCINPNLRQNVASYFIVSLAVSDIATACFSMPFDLESFVTFGWWYHGEVLCIVWTTAYLITVPTSMWNLFILSIDRYKTLKNPWDRFKASPFMTKRRAVVAIAVLWILCMSYALLPEMGWRYQENTLYIPRNCLIAKCIFNVTPLNSILSGILNFWLPMLAMCFLYYKIYQIARTQYLRPTSALELRFTDTNSPAQKANGLRNKSKELINQTGRKDDFGSCKNGAARIKNMVQPGETNVAVEIEAKHNRSGTMTEELEPPLDDNVTTNCDTLTDREKGHETTSDERQIEGVQVEIESPKRITSSGTADRQLEDDLQQEHTNDSIENENETSVKNDDDICRDLDDAGGKSEHELQKEKENSGQDDMDIENEKLNENSCGFDNKELEAEQREENRRNGLFVQGKGTSDESSKVLPTLPPPYGENEEHDTVPTDGVNQEEHDIARTDEECRVESQTFEKENDPNEHVSTNPESMTAIEPVIVDVSNDDVIVAPLNEQDGISDMGVTTTEVSTRDESRGAANPGIVSMQEYLRKRITDEDRAKSGSRDSLENLTKVEFYSVEGDAILEVREKCSCTFGRLAEKLHSEFKDRDASLEYFTFQSTSIATMDADQHIGLSNLHIKVYPAGEENWDEKWPWRISSQGLIQLRV
ncbi:hypothetical protein QZH41_013410, partial [Actinostola sp. cb2023]